MKDFETLFWAILNIVDCKAGSNPSQKYFEAFTSFIILEM